MSWVAVAAASAGLLKSAAIDRPREDRQRKLKAEQERYSGWTGRAPDQKIQEADPVGSALTYGVGGAQLAQNSALNDANINWLNKSAEHGGYGSSLSLNNSGQNALNYFNQAGPNTRYGAGPWGF